MEKKRFNAVILVVLCGLFFVQATSAKPQTVVSDADSIRGAVVDAEGNAVPFATVALLQSSDSAFVSGAVTDDAGKFALAADPRGGLLMVSCVGYDTQYCEPSDGMTVILKQTAIMVEGVVVKGSRPVYRMDERGFVAPIENTVLSKLGNGMDVLNQLPFVKEEGDGVSIMGQQGGLLVYINKRKMEDWNELRQLSSYDIKAVRIVTNPGSEYGANVGTVILITTLRPTGEGLGGYAMAEGRQAKDFKSTARVNLNYRRGDTDVFGGAYLMNNVTRVGHDDQHRFLYEQETYETLSSGQQKTKYSWLWMNVGMNHQPDDRQYISLQYSFDTYLRNKTHLDRDNIFSGGGEKEEFKSATDFDETQFRHRLTAYYSNQLSEKWSVALDGIWAHYGSGEDQEEHENRYDTQQQIQTESRSRTDMYALKGVATGKILAGELNCGAEGIYTCSRQDYQAVQQAGNGIPDSDTEARQKSGSLFASYRRSLGNLSGEVGVRYEYVDFRFYNAGVLSADDSRTYHHLFPNLSLSYRIGQAALTAGYRVGVSRPSYYLMRSGISFANSFLYYQGNPKLQPEYTHRYSVSAAWRDLHLSLSYSHCVDRCVNMLSLYENQPVVLSGNQNTDADYLRCTMSWSPTFGCWKPSLSLSFEKQYLEFYGITYNQPVFSYSFKNVVTLPHDWQVVINAGGHSQGQSNIYTARAALLYSSEVYASKKIGKWTLRVGAYDLFHTSNDDGYNRQGDIYQRHKADINQQCVYVRATYRFNAIQSKYKGGTAGESEMNRF